MLARLGQRATLLTKITRSSSTSNKGAVEKVETQVKDALEKEGTLLSGGKSEPASRPIKFTTSEAYVNYKASENFHGDSRDLPDSHNMVLATSFISGIFYLFYLRDDTDNDGGLALFKPVHESAPQYAIPLLQSAIAENRKLGHDTSKLEKKLKSYLEHPEKYGGETKKLVEN